MKTTIIEISNVTESNKYKGAYEKIFNIINKDRIFSEAYETDDSIGLVGSTYYLTISETLDSNVYELISKIKNVKIK